MTTITIDRAVVEQALEALENAEDQLAKPYSTDASKAIDALRAALAQQASRPSAPPAPARAPAPAPKAAPKSGTGFDDMDDDIPF